MFGFVTKARRDADVAQAIEDERTAAGRRIGAVAHENANLKVLIDRRAADIAALKAQLSEQQLIVAALKPDAEKWRTKVAKDKAYEAKRVRKPRAKKGA
jgi:hypothetical protein